MQVGLIHYVFDLSSQYSKFKIESDTTESPTLAQSTRGGRKLGSKNKKTSSSQKLGCHNQHLPALNDDGEKRLEQYIKAMKKIRIDRNNHGSLGDCVRLALQSNRRGTLRSSLLSLLREDEHRQAPKEVVERAYRDSMAEEVEELSKYPLFGKYTPDVLDQVQQLDSSDEG